MNRPGVRGRTSSVDSLLRVVGALALLTVAVVHLDKAPDYVGLGTRPLSLSDQFYAQSAAAVLLALGLLALPRLVARLGRRGRLGAVVVPVVVWGAAAGLAAVSLAALLYSRYRPLPIPGLPGGFQEGWDVPGDLFGVAEYGSAVASGVAEAVLLVVALAGLARAVTASRRAEPPSAG